MPDSRVELEFSDVPTPVPNTLCGPGVTLPPTEAPTIAPTACEPMYDGEEERHGNFDLFHDPIIKILQQDTRAVNVSFQIYQGFMDSMLDLLAVKYDESASGSSVCKESEFVRPGFLPEVHTAKCDDKGFAKVVVFALDVSFYNAEHAPNTSGCNGLDPQGDDSFIFSMTYRYVLIFY